MNATIFAAFENWIKQRSGIEWGNYGGDGKAFRQEQRNISQQRARARKALGQAQWYEFNAEAMRDALKAYSGRLEWIDNTSEPNGGHFEYCTGQYFPTEFAMAAAVALERYIDAARPKKEPRPDADFNTIGQIKSAHWNAGGHWFDKDSVRFFRSRILPKVYSGPGGVYFVSSEDSGIGSTGRRFTVRQFNPKTADVNTFGPFNELDKPRAMRLARMAAQHLDDAKEAIAPGGWASKEPSTTAVCIQDGCGLSFDVTITPEPAANLKPFWHRYCPKHREVSA